MLFPAGTHVHIEKGTVQIYYDRAWGGGIDVQIWDTPWEFTGFVTPIDYEIDLRNPADSTRVVDERNGHVYMFIDAFVKGGITEEHL